ncbi:MAG: polysaccharide deacetylase family protein [Gemmatimonadetes bacterium]|nr:polysaccharide deacetylase family protein [Gemmatimonadota bacterium]
MMVMGDIVARAQTTDSVVALTFDDGPTPEYTDSILDLLRRERVRATFFVVGGSLAQHPELGRRIVEAGHVLGNHTWSHPRMVGLPLAEVRRQVDDTDRLIRLAGQRGPIYFRAPYSHKFVLLPWHLHRTGRTNVSWDVEPETYETSADAIVRHTMERVRPGSIILLHPWFHSRDATRQALPRLIHALRAEGYELVTVPELLSREGVRSEPVSENTGSHADVRPA